jgi:cardiolipin synthase
MKKQKKSQKEKTYTIPNFLSLIRIIASPLLVVLVFHGLKLWPIIILFGIAAFTDFLDGYIARRFNQVTNTGRKLDMIADRILMLSAIIAILSYMMLNNIITPDHILLIILILSREILSAPFFIIAMTLKRRPIPHARFAGKLMTLMQGITFPTIILGWAIAYVLVAVTCIVGIVSAGYYVYDSLINPNNKFQKELDKHYEKL